MSITIDKIPHEPFTPRVYRIRMIFPERFGIEPLCVPTAEHVGPFMRDLYPGVPLNEMRFEKIDPPIVVSTRIVPIIETK